MKKFIVLICSLLLVCFSLSACSLDFSDTIEQKMDELYNTIRDMAEPFLKEDDSYKNEEPLPENEITANEGQTDEN